MCKGTRQRQMYNPGLQESLLQLIQNSGRVPPETAPEGKGSETVAWFSVMCSSRHKSTPFWCTGNQTSTAEWQKGLLMEFRSKRKCAESRSGCESTETTAPVSETLENIAITQWITIHYCLFLSQEKIIFFLKTDCNHYF